MFTTVVLMTEKDVERLINRIEKEFKEKWSEQIQELSKTAGVISSLVWHYKEHIRRFFHTIRIAHDVDGIGVLYKEFFVRIVNEMEFLTFIKGFYDEGLYSVVSRLYKEMKSGG